jgi:hypothetical protein
LKLARLVNHSPYHPPSLFGNENGTILSYGPSPKVYITTDSGNTRVPHPLSSNGSATGLNRYPPDPLLRPTPKTWFALTLWI